MSALVDLALLAGLAAVGALVWRASRRRAQRTAALAEARGQLADELIHSAEQERRRLAGAIHDGPVQQLMLARASLAAGAGAGVSRADADAAEAAIGEAIDQLRGSMQDLHSHVLEFAGLEAALEGEAARAAPPGLRCDIAVDPAAIGFRDALLFSVARELLLNATRHAHGSRVAVAVTREGDVLRLVVRDDGTGFDDDRRLASLRAGHVGLASCAHRVESIGGSFQIASDGTGTEIAVTIPIAQREEGAGTLRAAPHPSIGVLPKSAR